MFVHEFGGDHRSWEPQMRYFSRRYRCVTFGARGYPPSDVPSDVDSYSQERAVKDIRDVLDHLGVDKAHIIGLSMGGFATLHFGLMFPERAISLVVAGAGYGAEKQFEAYFKDVSEQVAQNFLKLGSEKFAPTYAVGASRVQFQNKDPRGWAEFAAWLGQHSAQGSANTMRGVQARRPSIYDLEAKLKMMDRPTLIIVGDEDDHCLQPGIFMKKTIPTSGLLILPKSGHTVNLEEPEMLNRHIAEFLAMVEAGKWTNRDPRANPAEIMRISVEAHS
jgi:pimeloyl-ACP methyl ester carboxylesterase